MFLKKAAPVAFSKTSFFSKKNVFGSDIFGIGISQRSSAVQDCMMDAGTGMRMQAPQQLQKL